MRQLIILLSILALGFTAKAQVPGYMGKRHLFTYTPSMSLFSNEYRVQQKASTHFFFTHLLSYYYVIKKNKAIGLFYDYAGYNVYAGAAGRDELQQYIYADFKKHQIGFQYRKYFRSRNLAPLGTYMRYSISALKATTTMKEASIPYYYADGDRGDTEISNWDVAVGIGIGKQFVIAKYVPLNFELNVQLPWSQLFAYPTAPLETSHTYSVIGTTLFKVNVGIGILAF